MRTAVKLAFAGLLAIGAATIGTTAPSNAGVSISFGLYDRDYDYYRPCTFYYSRGIPAPHRCYTYFRRYYGRGIYFDGDFVFRSRNDFWRWRDRDDYRHWRNHEFHDYWDHRRGDHDHH